MTGAEHYATAEKLLRDASDVYRSENVKDDALPSLERRAQAHATLALAAAVERQTGLAHGVDNSGYGR